MISFSGNLKQYTIHDEFDDINSISDETLSHVIIIILTLKIIKTKPLINKSCSILLKY